MVVPNVYWTGTKVVKDSKGAVRSPEMIDRKPVSRALPVTVIAGKEVELLLDSHEAAAVLGVHPRTLQRMAQRGQIAGVQVGKLWRFRASSLSTWIDNRPLGVIRMCWVSTTMFINDAPASAILTVARSAAGRGET